MLDITRGALMALPFRFASEYADELPTPGIDGERSLRGAYTSSGDEPPLSRLVDRLYECAESMADEYPEVPNPLTGIDLVPMHHDADDGDVVMVRRGVTLEPGCTSERIVMVRVDLDGLPGEAAGLRRFAVEICEGIVALARAEGARS